MSDARLRHRTRLVDPHERVAWEAAVAELQRSGGEVCPGSWRPAGVEGFCPPHAPGVRPGACRDCWEPHALAAAPLARALGSRWRGPAAAIVRAVQRSSPLLWPWLAERRPGRDRGGAARDLAHALRRATPAFARGGQGSWPRKAWRAEVRRALGKDPRIKQGRRGGVRSTPALPEEHDQGDLFA